MIHVRIVARGRSAGLHVCPNHTLPVRSIELSEESRCGQTAGLLPTQVAQVVVCPNPLDGAPLLLRLEQGVSTEVSGLVRRCRRFVHCWEVFGHGLL